MALTRATGKQVTLKHSGTGSVVRNVQDKLEEFASVLDFGADATGASDTQTQLQAALDSGASSVYVPAGTYRCDSTLNIPRDVSLVGDGPQTIFDFSNATSLTDNECLRTQGGSFTQLPALGSATSKGDDTITFASAPSVSPGDVLVIYNDTDGSWSNWRSYYRAGEYVRVMKVDGNTITIDGVVHDDYATADVDVYKCTNFTSCRLANFKVIGNKAISAKTVDAVVLRMAIDSTIENVTAVQTSYIGIAVVQCFNASVLHCSAKDEGDIDVAGDYGLAVSNSHLVTVTGGEFVSARHGITVGGGSGIGKVSNRFLNFDSCYIATVGRMIQAADIHGNAEFVTYNNCYIVGGITPGGDHTTISNCTILYGVNNGKTTAYYSEFKGFNHSFINNRVINNGTPDNSRGYFIDMGGNSDIMSNLTRGGVVEISGNTFTLADPDVTLSNSIYVYDILTAGTTEPRDINVSNNIMVAPNWDYDKRQQISDSVIVRTSSSATSRFRSINIEGNKLHGSIRINNGNPANVSIADQVIITNNHLYEGQGCYVSRADLISVRNNTFKNQDFYGMLLTGDSSAKTPFVFVEGNQFINCGWRHTSSSSQNADLIVWRTQNAVVQNNNSFGNFETLRVIGPDDAGSFTVGETITGGTSGETAIIQAVRDPFIFVRDSASGAFSASEVITGSTSGHTCTLESGSNRQVFKTYYMMSFLQNDNLWFDHNTTQHSSGNYTSGNTNVITTI